MNQVHDMTMAEFGRITDGLGGNGGHAVSVHLFGRSRGKYHTESQTGEQGEPQGIVFVYVQDAGNADCTTGAMSGGNGI